MISALIQWCAGHRYTVLAITAALCAWALAVLGRLPLDAIPDLSDTQVIVYSKWDRSPDVVEAQVTYPVVQALLGLPRAKSVRAFSDFGYSYVYAIFEDGTDLTWARGKVLEKLAGLQGQLPEGVKAELGPEATGVGWVYQYALVDKSGQQDLADLRALQDWDLKFQLQSVAGVAEVASVGGQLKQLQVRVDPLRLQAAGVGLLEVVQAVRASNVEMGARVLEINGYEFMVRGRGFASTAADVGAAPLRQDSRKGAVLRVRDVAQVVWGADMRRGVTDLDGQGDAVGGIVVMRQGENAPQVIARVKERLASLRGSLPKGVEILPVYDRSSLIERAIDTITHELVLQMIVVSLVVLIFLWHIPSALIPIITLPISVLLAFLPLHWMGISVNIMSLAGIAVAIGAMVDASIVVVENSHKRIEEWDEKGRKGSFESVLVQAIQEVARPSFYSLLVIAVAFLPVFALQGMEGRLFKPLAFTKNLSMALAAVLAITLDPALRLALFRLQPYKLRWSWLTKTVNTLFVGKTVPEERHPISRWLYKVYEPVVDWVLTHPRRTLVLALALLLSTAVPWSRLGSEFMPNLDEGDLLYMPTALPGLSATEAQRLLQKQDLILKSFPEVERVFGKAGRAETSTDVAPFSMVETTVLLKPKSQWSKKETTAQLSARMNEALRFAGMPNIWTMPIRNRVDMLNTGVRTAVGIKVLGADLGDVEKAAVAVEAALKPLRGSRSVLAERATGGYFLDVDWDREALGRYGLSVEDAQMHLAAAVGGDNVSTLVLGRQRFGLAVRYQPDFRDSAEDIKRVQLQAMAKAGMPAPGPVLLGQVATVKKLEGPAMIRNEDGRLASYVYVDVDQDLRDLGSYVDEARQAVAKLNLPAGVSLRFSGQVENMQRARATLQWVLPLTLLLVVFLLYMNSRSWTRTVIILLAVPFSLIGAAWLLWALGYHLSVAVWVGLIALAGLDAETGMFMLLYLELAHDDAKAKGKLKTEAQLRAAIHHGAVKRVRPKVMTVACAFIGLLPVMLSNGSGADVMKRIAAPMVGGLASSFALELAVYPAVYYLWKLNSEVIPASEKRPARGFWGWVARLG
jgi:Cu(I)/Ag(I) efflux system membrane protein CusA/SilA